MMDLGAAPLVVGESARLGPAALTYTEVGVRLPVAPDGSVRVTALEWRLAALEDRVAELEARAWMAVWSRVVHWCRRLLGGI